MRWQLRVLGVTVASVTFDADRAGEDCAEIGGGSGHNFERAEVWNWETEERGFGFH